MNWKKLKEKHKRKEKKPRRLRDNSRLLNKKQRRKLDSKNNRKKKDLKEKQCAMFALKNLGFDCKRENNVEF